MSETSFTMRSQARPEQPIAILESHLFILDPLPVGQEQEFTSYHVDGIGYIVRRQAGRAPCCIFSTVALDQVTLLWVSAAVVVIGTLGTYLLKLKFDAGKVAKILTSAITESGKVRDALFAFSAASAATMGGMVLALLRALYDFGVMRKLLECFSMSWFSGLKFLTYLAPYAGQIILAEQLLELGVKMYQDFKKTQPKLNVRPPSPFVTASSQQITVNGDPVTVYVSLDGPPPEGGAEVICTSLNLQMVPSSLVFTANNFAQRQSVIVTKSSAAALHEQDDKPLVMEFGGPGLSNGATLEIKQRVAKVAIDPSTKVALALDQDKKNYSGKFSLLVTADIPDATVITYDFYIDDKPIAETPFKVTKTSDLASTNSRKRKTSYTISQPADTSVPKRVKLEVKQHAHNPVVPVASAGDDAMVDVPLVSNVAETIQLTMVNGKSGNCFILRNEDKDDNVVYALIDGGKRKTYENMKPYLPTDTRDANAKILMYCSHFDDDHIMGLLELMQDATQNARVKQVFFNPPSVQMTKLAAAAPKGWRRKIVNSIGQGNKLKAYAVGRLTSPKGYYAPPVTPLDEGKMPTLDILMAGPSLSMLAELKTAESVPKSARYSHAVNRASLAFLVQSRMSNFRFMQTGDSYGSSAGTGLLGTAINPASVAMLDFLQVQHHGSRNNCCELFFRNYPARNYLISTNFTTFKHPHREMMAQLFAANAARVDDWNIYINAPATAAIVAAMRLFYQFPALPSTYKVYLRNENSTGIVFTYSNNEVTVNATDLYTLHS